MNGHVLAGPSREMFLEPVPGPAGFDAALDRALVEIRFPITPA
jgi:hypothetical protein